MKFAVDEVIGTFPPLLVPFMLTLMNFWRSSSDYLIYLGIGIPPLAFTTPQMLPLVDPLRVLDVRGAIPIDDGILFFEVSLAVEAPLYFELPVDLVMV
jgi:hypothetical protein